MHWHCGCVGRALSKGPVRPIMRGWNCCTYLATRGGSSRSGSMLMNTGCTWYPCSFSAQQRTGVLAHVGRAITMNASAPTSAASKGQHSATVAIRPQRSAQRMEILESSGWGPTDVVQRLDELLQLVGADVGTCGHW